MGRLTQPIMTIFPSRGSSINKTPLCLPVDSAAEGNGVKSGITIIIKKKKRPLSQLMSHFVKGNSGFVSISIIADRILLSQSALEVGTPANPLFLLKK